MPIVQVTYTSPIQLMKSTSEYKSSSLLESNNFYDKIQIQIQALNRIIEYSTIYVFKLCIGISFGKSNLFKRYDGINYGKSQVFTFSVRINYGKSNGLKFSVGIN